MPNELPCFHNRHLFTIYRASNADKPQPKDCAVVARHEGRVYTRPEESPLNRTPNNLQDAIMLFVNLQDAIVLILQPAKAG